MICRDILRLRFLKLFEIDYTRNSNIKIVFNRFLSSDFVICDIFI